MCQFWYGSCLLFRLLPPWIMAPFLVWRGRPQNVRYHAIYKVSCAMQSPGHCDGSSLCNPAFLLLIKISLWQKDYFSHIILQSGDSSWSSESLFCYLRNEGGGLGDFQGLHLLYNFTCIQMLLLPCTFLRRRLITFLVQSCMTGATCLRLASSYVHYTLQHKY